MFSNVVPGYDTGTKKTSRFDQKRDDKFSYRPKLIFRPLPRPPPPSSSPADRTYAGYSAAREDERFQRIYSGENTLAETNDRNFEFSLSFEIYRKIMESP